MRNKTFLHLIRMQIILFFVVLWIQGARRVVICHAHLCNEQLSLGSKRRNSSLGLGQTWRREQVEAKFPLTRVRSKDPFSKFRTNAFNRYGVLRYRRVYFRRSIPNHFSLCVNTLVVSEEDFLFILRFGPLRTEMELRGYCRVRTSSWFKVYSCGYPLIISLNPCVGVEIP